MITTDIKSFMTGIVFTCLIFASYSFYTTGSDNSKEINQSGITSITPQQAQTYRNNYLAKNGGGLTAVNLSVQQWDAINLSVRNRNGNLDGISGFRLYFGVDNSAGREDLVSVTYMIDNQLNEIPPQSNLPMAQGFPSNFSSQCPPFCD